MNFKTKQRKQKSLIMLNKNICFFVTHSETLILNASGNDDEKVEDTFMDVLKLIYFLIYR